MKKIYLSVLSLAIAAGASAQKQTQNKSFKKSLPVASSMNAAKPTNNMTKAAPLWSNTFANQADWTVGHDATACSLDWTFNTSCQGSVSQLLISSQLLLQMVGQWWILIFYGGDTGGSEVEDSWITTTNPIY